MTARSISGRELFYDDTDRYRYLGLLADEIDKRDWSVLAYCLMGNHIHLLVLTPRPDLGLGIKRAHEQFAGFINERYGRRGHVFGARFYSKVVETDAHLLACLRYIARNPVDAGLCADARQWPWSSHSFLAGNHDPPPLLDREAVLARLAADGGDGRARYLDLVGTDDRQIVSALRSRFPSGWVAIARDIHGFSIKRLAQLTGISEAALYRLARASAN